MPSAFNTFAAMGNQQRIVVTVSNDLNTDQRVKKMCSSLQLLGYEIILQGRIKKDSAAINRNYKVKRFKLWFNKGALFYINLNIRLFFYLLFSNYDRIHANDLDTLLAAFLASKIRSKPLVYDSHEIFSEVPEIQGRWVKKVWVGLENFLLPRVENIITVNQSIANYYGKKFNKKIYVIRNIPEKKKGFSPKGRMELNLPEKMFIAIVQGTGINIDRGNEELLSSMKMLSNILLLFVGSGDAISRLKTIVKDEELDEKVKFIDKMPYDELIHYTANANLGISLDKATNLNYLFSLPNKIFDFISVGTPILASELPEVAGIVRNYNVGIVIDNVDPQSIAAGIKSMMETDPVQWDENLKIASKELTWEKESAVLEQIYK